MAITFVKEVVTGSTKVSTNPVVVTIPAGGVAAGNRLKLHFSGARAELILPTGVTDTRGNTWAEEESLPVVAGVTNGAAAIWSCHVDTALQSGDTVSITLGEVSGVGRCWAFEEFAGVLDTSPIDVTNSATSGSGGSGSPSVAATQTAGDARLVTGTVGGQGEPPAFTDDADSDGGDTWHTVPTALGTTGGSASTNAYLYGTYKIVASATTTHTFNPTISPSSKWVDLISLLKEEAAPAPPPAAFGVAGQQLWSANHEPTAAGGPRATGGGNTTVPQWYLPEDGATGNYGGGEFNDSGLTTERSTAQAADGVASVVLSQTGNGLGARLFRWRELHNHRELRLSSYYFVPSVPTVFEGDQWWNVMQIKSIQVSPALNDPIWIMEFLPSDWLGGSAGGLRIRYAWTIQAAAEMEGPHSGENGWRTYNPGVDIPIAEWFEVAWELKQANDYTGYLRIFLDGTQIAEQTSIKTGYVNSTKNSWQVEQSWAVTNYSGGLTPDPFPIYADNARILLATPPTSAGMFAPQLKPAGWF